MTPTTRKRSIHLAGLILCLTAIYLVAGGDGIKSVVGLAVAGLGLVGNAYGVLRPNTWIR